MRSVGKICNLGSLRLHLLAFQALIISCKSWSGGCWVCRTCSAAHVKANDPGIIYSNVVMWGTNFVAHVIQMSSSVQRDQRNQGFQEPEELLSCDCAESSYSYMKNHFTANVTTSTAREYDVTNTSNVTPLWRYTTETVLVRL